jgi:hypothetical protein
VDSNLLEAVDRRIAKIYVEIDIQAGLSEILEIDWRNHLHSQRLDYLGIPFRCSICRRTGHLRRDCSRFPPPEVILDPAEETNFNGYISSPNQPVETSFSQRNDSSPDDSLLGKLQLLCPSLYNTLSASDRLFIIEQTDTILPPEHSSSLPDHVTPIHTTIQPTAPEPSTSIPNTTLPITYPARATETDSFSASEVAQDPIPIAGHTEPSQSETQLDALIQDSFPVPSLPFDSIPIHTYLGKNLVQSSGSHSDRPSSSGVNPSPVLDPTWSRGVGLELSPLKTRSARKKTLTGSSSAVSTIPVPSQGALRGLKALARGKS